MEINIDDRTRTVEVWMTKEEKADYANTNKLKSFYRRCSDQKYGVAVFLSGEGNLFENSRDLLLHNRDNG